MAVATILKHYGRFVHSSQTDAIELARIDREQPSLEEAQFGQHFRHRDVPIGKNRDFPRFQWRPRRDLNPCYRRERPVS